MNKVIRVTDEDVTIISDEYGVITVNKTDNNNDEVNYLMVHDEVEVYHDYENNEYIVINKLNDGDFIIEEEADNSSDMDRLNRMFSELEEDEDKINRDYLKMTMPGYVNKWLFILIAVFLGALGGQKFYIGKIWSGILMLALSWTPIPAIVATIDVIRALMKPQDENGNIYMR